MIEVIDISGKPEVNRYAVAAGCIKLNQSSIVAIKNKTVKKGDVINTSKVAAINAVKATPSIIPLCHPIPISNVKVEVQLMESNNLV